MKAVKKTPEPEFTYVAAENRPLKTQYDKYETINNGVPHKPFVKSSNIINPFGLLEFLS